MVCDSENMDPDKLPSHQSNQSVMMTFTIYTNDNIPSKRQIQTPVQRFPVTIPAKYKIIICENSTGAIVSSMFLFIISETQLVKHIKYSNFALE